MQLNDDGLVPGQIVDDKTIRQVEASRKNKQAHEPEKNDKPKAKRTVKKASE